MTCFPDCEREPRDHHLGRCRNAVGALVPGELAVMHIRNLDYSRMRSKPAWGGVATGVADGILTALEQGGPGMLVSISADKHAVDGEKAVALLYAIDESVLWLAARRSRPLDLTRRPLFRSFSYALASGSMQVLG